MCAAISDTCTWQAKGLTKKVIIGLMILNSWNCFSNWLRSNWRLTTNEDKTILASSIIFFIFGKCTSDFICRCDIYKTCLVLNEVTDPIFVAICKYFPCSFKFKWFNFSIISVMKLKSTSQQESINSTKLTNLERVLSLLSQRASLWRIRSGSSEFSNRALKRWCYNGAARIKLIIFVTIFMTCPMGSILPHKTSWWIIQWYDIMFGNDLSFLQRAIIHITNHCWCTISGHRRELVQKHIYRLCTCFKYVTYIFSSVVRLFMGNISSRSSFTVKLLNTILIITANCAMSFIPVDSSNCSENQSHISIWLFNWVCMFFEMSWFFLWRCYLTTVNLVLPHNLTFVGKSIRQSAPVRNASFNNSPSWKGFFFFASIWEIIKEAIVAFLDLTTGLVKTNCWTDRFDFSWDIFFFLNSDFSG